MKALMDAMLMIRPHRCRAMTRAAAWPQRNAPVRFTARTRLLTVIDREGDIFELFLDAEPTRKRVGLLVRAKHNRRLEGEERKLFEELKASPHRAQIEVVIPRQRWKKAKGANDEQQAIPGRRGLLTVRFQEITVAS